jgi:hypothetical protein
VEHPIEKVAKEALTNDDYETDPGYCQRFVRQVVHAVYGSRYEQYRGQDAKDSARLWRHSQLCVNPKNGSVPGDILYFEHRHGPHGHVVIRIHGNKVAENSVVHSNGRHGGKGTRELWQLGTPSLIVRLPKDATNR